ncbi:hypothetical protein GGF31_003969 [Allomyces arbusculus]|nr:hypothetical protein GGF31_003969 [Allomyces arbusculus]
MPALPLPRSVAHAAMPPLTTTTARTVAADTRSPVRATRLVARADDDGALRITDSPGSLTDPHTSVQVAKTGVSSSDNNASSTTSDTSAVAVGSVVIYVLGALIAFVVLVYVLYWLLAFPLPWIRRWYRRHKSRRQLCRALSHSDKFPVFRFDPLAVRPRTTARGCGDTEPTSSAATAPVTRANSPCASLTAADAFVPVAVELSPVIPTRRIDDDDDLVPVVRGAARDDETGAFVAISLDGDVPVAAPAAADDDQTPLALAGALAMTAPLPVPRVATVYAPMCTSPIDSADPEVAHHAVLVEYAPATDTTSCAGSSSRISSTASSRSGSSCSSSVCSSSRPVSAHHDASIVAASVDQGDASPRTGTVAGEQDGFVSTTSLTCSICLEDYELNDAIRELPCHHDFHAKCVQPWLERALTDRVIACPVCRASWPLSSLTQDLHRSPTGTASSTRARLRRWRHRTLSGLSTSSTHAAMAAAMAAAPTTVTPPRAHHRLRRAVTTTIDHPHHPRHHHHHGLHRHGTTGAHSRAVTTASDARRSAHTRTLSGWAAVWNRSRSRSDETTRDVVWSRSAATSPAPPQVREYAPLAPTTVQPQTTVVFAAVLPAPEPAHLGDE